MLAPYLRAGMLVQLRNTQFYFILPTRSSKANFVLHRLDQPLINTKPIHAIFNADLLYDGCEDDNSKYDVIRIFKIPNYVEDGFSNAIDSSRLIWEREESSEEEILAALTTLGLTYLARDSNGDLFAYPEAPKKEGGRWNSNADSCDIFRLPSYLFKDIIKWIDKHPYHF